METIMMSVLYVLCEDLRFIVEDPLIIITTMMNMRMTFMMKEQDAEIDQEIEDLFMMTTTLEGCKI
jgi:hypothetical protein